MLYQIKQLIRKLTPKFVISTYHFLLSFLGAFIYWFPSRKPIVIGVTGTKGKTTTCEIISHILEQSGAKTAIADSLRFKIDQKTWANKMKMTMPGRFFLQRFIYRARKNNCQFIILEVTSIGLDQHRHRFIDFDMAVFLNLQPEHLESHKNSMEEYCHAKEKLFNALSSSVKRRSIVDRRGIMDFPVKKSSIVNLDEEVSKMFLSHWAEKKAGFCLQLRNSENQKLDLCLHPKSYNSDKRGISFILDDFEFFSPLKGGFNLYNILAAITATSCLGAPMGIIKEALKNFDGVPGRMEEIDEGQDFRVVVDFAHTPDSLGAVYKDLRSELSLKNKLIGILGGTGGGRDKWKRPVMGEIAEKYCDEIIITDEDPYDENPRKIMEDVAEGIKDENKKYKIIENRREAIIAGLKMCKSGDTFVITGKGSDQVMAVGGGKKISWDDRDVVREELKKILEKN